MSLPKTANRALSPTRGDRILGIFRRSAVRIRDLGLSRQIFEDERFTGERVTLSGKRMLHFGLCSYLGLGDDERLKEGARGAIDRYGTSYSSSIAYTAVPPYRDLVERLTEMFDAHVVLAPTTTLAHLSALPILVRPGDAVIIDSQSHASVQTGAQLLSAAGIPVRSFSHSDPSALEATIAGIEVDGRKWLLVDGVYSMNGEVAQAVELNELLDRHTDLHVYCDDAHGFGWDGEHGRGTYLRRAGWHERLVIAAGLSKSFGATGGVIATRNAEWAEFIELCGPPLTFGGPIPPAALGAGLASAEIHLSDEIVDRQSELRRRISFVNRFSAEIGLPIQRRDDTPIWFVDVGEFDAMTKLLVAMSEAGFYLNASTFPVVPQGHAGLRFTVTLYNSIQHIEDMLTALNEYHLELFGDTEIELDLDHGDLAGSLD